MFVGCPVENLSCYKIFANTTWISTVGQTWRGMITIHAGVHKCSRTQQLPKTQTHHWDTARFHSLFQSWTQPIGTDKQEAPSFHCTDTFSHQRLSISQIVQVLSLTHGREVFRLKSMWVSKKCVFWKPTTHGNYFSYKELKALNECDTSANTHADKYTHTFDIVALH